MEPVYLELFNNKEDLINEFRLKKNELDNINILFAVYEYANWSGTAFVLFEQDGELYEVNGDHCSCYGLEGQWIPEKASFDELKHRLDKGEMGKHQGYDVFKRELKEYMEKNWPEIQ